MSGGEIRVDTVQLGGHQLRVIGPVQGPSLLTPLAEKITVGDHTRQDDLLLSSWVIANLRGGLGVARLDAQTQSDRYRYGTAWVLQDQANTIGPLPTEITDGVPVNTTGRLAVTYHDDLYVVFDTVIRVLNEEATGFGVPVEPGYADLLDNGVDGLTIRLAGTDYLCISDSNGLATFNGTTWVRVVGDGTTKPHAVWLQEFDSKLYCLDLNNVLWRTADLTTWTKLTAVLPVSPLETRGLDLFFAPDESPRLHVPVLTGLLLYDTEADVWAWTRLTRVPRHKDGGRGHVQWRDEYYWSSGMEVYHYQGSTISPASLNRDDGLPRDMQGSIVALEAMPSWLAAAVSGGESLMNPVHYRGDALNLDASRAPDVAAQSAIYLWTGAAWQPLWLSPVSGAAIKFLHYSDAGNTYRLWWNANDRIYYLQFDQAVFQPRGSPTWPYAPRAYIESGRFDGNWPEQLKLACRAKVRLRNASATERVNISYRFDGSDAWVLIGVATANGLTTFELEDTPGAGDGMLFYDAELRLGLERGTDPHLAPILVMAKLEYARRPDERFGYRFQCVVDEGSDDSTPEEVVQHLMALAAEKHRIPFEYRIEGRSPVRRNVLVSQWTAITMPGVETTGRWMCSLVEP